MPKPAPLPLSEKHLADCRASTLKDETIRVNGVVTKENALFFPYRNLDGEVNCFGRWKPDNPRVDKDGKPIKYEQAKGTTVRAYFPVECLAKLNDGTSPIFITEGEKKALAPAQLGYAVVGLGGIWGAAQKDGKGGHVLIPDLATLPLDSREVNVVFDWDPEEETREDVAKAIKRTAAVFVAAGAGEARNIKLPPGPGKTKNGVDDYLMAQGDGAADAFAELVAQAKPITAPKSAAGDPTYADELVALVLQDAELWHTPEQVGCATIRRGQHREHWPIKSQTFVRLLAKLFWDHKGKVLGSSTLADAVNTLVGKALFEGEEYPRRLRVGEHEGRLYLDLADENWGAIRIGTEDWDIDPNPPVRFVRPTHMRPLPEPVAGGSVAELREFLNVADEQWPLVLGWLVGTFMPNGPYAHLKLCGEQGSAKTTAAKVLRSFVDPNSCPTRSLPRSEPDLQIGAAQNWVCSFDNLSYVDGDMSDALCRLSTGGGSGTRTHYEMDEETVLNSLRPAILNGIEDIGTRSDLMDRCLIVDLPRIPDEKRRPERVFEAELAAVAPRIFGALLTAVSVALKNLPAVQARTDVIWPRMADFAQWVVAAEPALGLKEGEFLRAYKSNRADANQIALESCKVSDDIMKLVKKKAFFGTATELLTQLEIGMSDQDRRAKEWPKNARSLSNRLKRVAPNLRNSGYVVEQTVEGNEKKWRIAVLAASANSQDSQTGKLPRKAP
jgi:hypothetical protein